MAEGLIYSPPSPSNPRYHHHHHHNGGEAASPGGRNGADTSRVNYNNATTGGFSATSRSHRRLDVDGLGRDSSYYRDAHEQWARGVDTLLRPGMTASHSAALAKWRAAHGIPEPAPAVVDAATTPERSVGPDKLDASVAAGTPGGRVANAFGLMKTRRLQEQLESLCTSDGSGEVDVDRALGILNSVESMLANGGPPAADRSHSRRGISTSSTATATATSRGASVGQQTATDDAAEEPKTRWRSVALNSVNTQTAAPPPPPPPPPATAEPQPARTESVNVTAPSAAMNGSGIDGGPDPSVPRLTRLPPRPADHRSQMPVRPPPHQHHTSSTYNGLSPEDVEAYKRWWQQYRSWYAQGGGNDADVEGAPRHHHHHDESTRTRHHRRDHHRHASAERSRSDSASRQPRHQHHHHQHQGGGSRSASVERLLRRASPGPYRPPPGRRDDDSDSRDSYDVSRQHHHQQRYPAPRAHQQQRTPPRARSTSPGLEAAAQWARTQHLHDRQVTRLSLMSSAPAATQHRSRPHQPQQQSHHQPLPPSTARQPIDQSGAATPPRSANVAASAAAAALSSLNVVSPMTDGDTSDEDHGGVGQISAIGRQRGAAGRFLETSMAASAGGGAYLPPPYDEDDYDGDGGRGIGADSQTLPPSSPAAAAANHRHASRDPAGADGPTPAFRVQSLAASTAASRSRQAIAMQQRSRTAQRVAPMRSPPRQRNPDYTGSAGRPSVAGAPRGYQNLQAPDRAGTAAMMARSRSGQPTGPTRR